MNKSWSELNKTMQLQLKKKETFEDGIITLLALRKMLIEQMHSFEKMLDAEDFSAIPFINANGYHSKTIAYSLYHVFRIEDIVAHTLIKKEPQIFFKKNYQQRMNSPIITTGNELVKQEIADFSEKLCVDELYQYISDVDDATTQILQYLTYQELKIKMTEQDRETLRSLQVVSEDEKANWLIDY